MPQPNRDGVQSTCYAVAFKPDGSQLVAAVGSRVLIYNAASGDLLHSLKGHRDSVYTVSYSASGERFASGSADKNVIVWTDKAEGILKYSHNDSVEAVEFNPVTHQLASATATDFGLWSPEEKSVVKHKTHSRILCLSWTSDGLYLALGMLDGAITLRDKHGTEKATIQRNAPVWALAWNPSKSEQEVLAVGCWDSTLSFYHLSGAQMGKDKELDFNPTSLSYFGSGEYICVGGTNRKAMLYTKDGVQLGTIAEGTSWTWAAKQKPKQNYVAVGTNSGQIMMQQLIFSTVHGLYQDRYAYRDNMTDVIIQHLITEQKVRIKCRDHVKKIAVYKNRLAVQLPNRIILYELSNDNAFDMHYRADTKIQKRVDCSLLVVTSHHLVLCLDKKLQLLNFSGVKEREWTLESATRYIKVVGGAAGREGLIVGLKSGEVVKVFVNNAFPIQLVNHKHSIRCLDLSACRTKLAVVDENAAVTVYNLLTSEVLYVGKNANSVAWNSEFPEMFCYSGNGMITIKTGNFPEHQQKLPGFVVGFKSSKVFCLHFVSMQTIDIPQSASMRSYVSKGQFHEAFGVACLGVTETDWKFLATEAMMSGALDIARVAFVRARDIKYVELIDRLEAGKRAGVNEGIFLAEVLAYQGKFHEAARLYAKASAPEKAMEMFSDLRQYDEARKWAQEYAEKAGDLSGRSVQELMQRQAEWCEEANDEEAACSMYIQAKKFEKALLLISKNGWHDKLLEIVRTVDSEKLLRQAAQIFREAKNHKHAKEAYTKLGDTKSLVILHVESEKWDEAFNLVRSHPQHSDEVHLPYAKWLALNDRFNEARVAYRQAGCPEQSTFVLEQLCHSSVMEKSFADTSYYFYQLALEAHYELTNSPSGSPKERDANLAKFNKYYKRAEVYYTYRHIHEYSNAAFTMTFATTLFNMGRFLLMALANEEAPHGVRLVSVLQCISKQAEDMGAFKLARHAYDLLHTMRVPRGFQDELDRATIRIRPKPFKDEEGLLPFCYRCGCVNPLLNREGDVCVNCGDRFIRSILTFEPLPLVRFHLEEGISHEEALECILQEPEDYQAGAAAPAPGSSVRGRSDDSADVLRISDPDEEFLNTVNVEDPFARQMAIPHRPILVDRKMLLGMPQHEILIRSLPGQDGSDRQYYRVMESEIPTVLTPSGHFCEQDEYEMHLLEHGSAPLCRTPAEEASPVALETAQWGSAGGLAPDSGSQ